MLWREAWAEVANKHLFLHGHDIRIDHRLNAQGIDLEPQHKIGPALAQERMARLEDHQRIARENGDKLIQDPEIALRAITHQQSTFLVVDEAGMVGSRQLERVLQEAHQNNAKVVLVGDPYQLQAIEAGAAFRAISETTPQVSLTEIRRQDIPWQREATVELATGKTLDAIARYNQHDHVHSLETQAAAKQSLVDMWNDVRINQPDKTHIMLSYTREDVKELNQIARDLRKEQGELGQDHPLKTEIGERQFAENDRIYFLKNDRDLSVKNGTLGTIERLQGDMLTIKLDKKEGHKDHRTITFSTDRYHHIDHGYAATVHKSQGVTVDRSYVLASKYMDGHATYVGMSRHRESADLFYSKEEFANERVLAATLGRERGKDVTLDYQRERFTQQRGFEKIVKSQERLLALTHSDAYYDQKLREAAQKYDQLEKEKGVTFNARDDFKAFKSQFEAEHPTQAKAIQEAIRPRHERLAIEAEKRIRSLEKSMRNSRMSQSARTELERYSAQISKQPSIMAYLKEHHPALSNKIQSFAKSHERSLSRGYGISR